MAYSSAGNSQSYRIAFMKEKRPFPGNHHYIDAGEYPSKGFENDATYLACGSTEGTGAPVLSSSNGERKYPRISVVIPTHNEAQNLHYILPRIPPLVSEVLLVDGHSTDDTIEVAKRLLPIIRIIEQVGKGKGDAVRIGFAACTGDIIVMLDGDGSTDPQEIPRFVQALLQGNDFAKGSRFIKGAGSTDITPLRLLGNYALCKLVNLLFWRRFSDLCYGYNAFWRYCLDYIDLDSDGFEVETQISLRMHKAHLRIVEVPSIEHPRIYGQSHLRTFRDGWRVFKTIMKERRQSVSSLPQPRHLGVPYSAVKHSLTHE